MVGLGFLPGSSGSDARAVSADGSVVVGTSGGEAFIWDAGHGMRSLKQVLTDDFGLDLSLWNLLEATGISADGRTIVGDGFQGFDSNQRAWIAIIPEPGTALLVIVGLLGLAARRV
jgi:hypothetical protein